MKGLLPIQELRKRIFEITTTDDFNALALEIFYFQATENKVYNAYLKHLETRPEEVTSLAEVPYLPIQFFKTHSVLTGEVKPEQVFTSSGTTGANTSQHLVADLGLYEKSFTTSFEQFYGPAKDLCILALLPAYLERKGSSLVYMADQLIHNSGHPDSGFYLNNLEELSEKLNRLKKENHPVLLIGVTFALLDLAESHPMELPNTIIMETGGMKGRRKEMVREEVHIVLKNAFHQSSIHSEYGMTELLSQAWSSGDGIFKAPPWMKIQTREPNDPFSALSEGKTGGINLIDLANLWSCSFIATQDLGRVYDDGTFEVLGRFDNSDLRGCNLMIG